MSTGRDVTPAMLIDARAVGVMLGVPETTVWKFDREGALPRSVEAGGSSAGTDRKSKAGSARGAHPRGMGNVALIYLCSPTQEDRAGKLPALIWGA